MQIADVQSQFTASGVYLNTASVGLPPRGTVDAVRDSVAAWSRGEVAGPDFDEPVSRCRERYAELVGVPVSDVALGSQTSQLVGHIAANLPRGSEVLIAEGDFTSMTFPFLAQQDRGVRVRELPMSELPDAVSESTTAVACALAQSTDGALLDADALQQACARTGALSVIDLTQAAGWLPVDASAFDVTVCSAYKWLMAPRGAAYLTVTPRVREDLVIHSASWAGGADVWSSIYGAPLRLAADAQRFDLSPAWFSWVGQLPALELILGVGVAAIHAHDVALAAGLRRSVDLPETGSAIVSLAVDDATVHRLREAGVAFAMRDGRARLAFHLYNDEDDAARVTALLKG